jgi:hypothetical protein
MYVISKMMAVTLEQAKDEIVDGTVLGMSVFVCVCVCVVNCVSLCGKYQSGTMPLSLSLHTYTHTYTPHPKQKTTGRIGAPEDVGGAAIFLASKAGAYVTGVVLPIDGGILVKPRL